jgi:hypothetical protein
MLKLKIAYYFKFLGTRKTYRVSQKKVGEKNWALLHITEKSSTFWKLIKKQTPREL